MQSTEPTLQLLSIDDESSVFGWHNEAKSAAFIPRCEAVV
jgi:hypothetical protein